MIKTCSPYILITRFSFSMAPVLSRPLRLACPCIGWDAPGHAFRRLGQPVEILYAYDTDVRVYKPLVALHGRAVVDRFCLGPYVGDICAVDYSNWECVDAIIAGPPCPPVSRIGLRFANEDPRQRVWDRCVDIIIDQGRKGAYFFVLEMVLGVTDRPRGGGESVATTFRRRLQTEAPMWAVVREWRMNSLDFVPQHRERVYFVGFNAASFHDNCAGPLPPVVANPCSCRALAEYLRRDLPWVDEGQLSGHVAERLAVHKAYAHQYVPCGVLISIELDRDWTKTWGSGSPVCFHRVGHIMTLRTNNGPIWLYGRSAFGSFSRALDPLERVALQGFPPWVAMGMDPQDVLRGAGNAMTVPVVQAVLARCLSTLCGAGQG